MPSEFLKGRLNIYCLTKATHHLSRTWSFHSFIKEREVKKSEREITNVFLCSSSPHTTCIMACRWILPIPIHIRSRAYAFTSARPRLFVVRPLQWWHDQSITMTVLYVTTSAAMNYCSYFIVPTHFVGHVTLQSALQPFLPLLENLGSIIHNCYFSNTFFYSVYHYLLTIHIIFSNHLAVYS